MPFPEQSPLQPQLPPEMEAPMAPPAPAAEEPALLFNPIQVKPVEGLTLEGALRSLNDDLMGKLKKRQSWRQPFETLWGQIYRLYMGKMDATTFATRAKVVMPKVFQAIEAGVPKLVSIIFGKFPWFSVVPEWPERSVPASVLHNIEALLNHQLKLANFFKKFLEFAKQLLLYGTAYFTVTWKVRREWVTERVADRKPRTFFGIPMPGYDLEWKVQKTLKVVERRPELTVLPIESVYPASDQVEVGDGEGIFYSDSISFEDLKALSQGRAPIYGNFAMVQEQKSSRPSDPLNTLSQERASARGITDPASPSVRDGESVELTHFWGKRDLDGDGFKEEVHIVTANRSIIVRAVPNPYEHQKRCIVKGNLFVVPNEWFGLGMVEPAIPALSALNTLHRQNLDQNSLILNRMWKVDPTMDVDLDTLVSTPNGIVLSTPLTAVEALDQGAMPFAPAQMIQLLETEIEATMAPKSIQGTTENGALGRTARGAQLIVNQALEKFGTAAKFIEEYVLNELLTQMHQLNAQYLDQDDYLKDIYDGIFPVKPTPEQIRANVGFKFLGVSETIDKEATVNQLTAYLNTWGALLQQMGINLMPLAKEHWKLLDMKANADEVLVPMELPPMPPQTPEGAAPEGAPASEAVASQVAQNGGASGGLELPPLQPLA